MKQCGSSAYLPCKMLICHWINGVAHHTEDVEPGEDWLGQVDVLGESHARVVTTTDRVCRGDDGAACLQGGHDPRLGDGDGLLLHRLVDRGPILQVIVNYIRPNKQ